MNKLGGNATTVGIVLPTFKPGSYILEMLESIERQILEYPAKDVELRLCVILNGPRSPYYNQLLQKITGLPFSSSLLFTSIAGVSHARNMGLEQCSESDYIIFVDDDDLLSDHFVSSLVQKISNVKSDRVIAQSNTRAFDEQGTDFGEHYISAGIRHILEVGNTRFSLYRYRVFLNSVCGKLFPRSLIGDLRFDEGLSISEDALFLFALSNRLDGIVLVPEVYYSIRHREGSASRKKKSLTKIIGEMFSFVHKLTRTYFRHPHPRTFLLYLSRVAASLKFMTQRIVHNR